MSKKFQSVLVWFRNDLRVHDNEILYRAAVDAKHVLPLYCFDSRLFGTTDVAKFPKTGYHRTRFLLESVADLRDNLKKLGANLIVHSGKPEEIIPTLVEKHQIESVYYQVEATKEETDVDKELTKILSNSKVSMTAFWGLTLFHIEDIPFNMKNLPDTYTGFRKVTESKSRVRDEFPTPKNLSLVTSVDEGVIPTIEQLGVKAPANYKPVFTGGETAALARLKHYFWDTNKVAQYKTTRNDMLGLDFSTKFSIWLWNGCISAKHIYHQLKKYENERTSNESTYWVVFELLWRDYFKFFGIKHGNKIFYLNGIQGNQGYVWGKDRGLLDKWCKGETGYPLVDANMRELNATGFMSNRGRQNVASFLIKDLGLDWRFGAEYFEYMLIDYDPTSNYGNWQYHAGVGVDPRNDRYFNIVKQAKQYDPDASFVLHWLPELNVLKENNAIASVIHQPWQSVVHAPYPKPIVKLKFGFVEKSSDPAANTHDIRKFFHNKDESNNNNQDREVDKQGNSKGKAREDSHKRSGGGSFGGRGRGRGRGGYFYSK